MAGRKKGARVKMGLVCSICNTHNYTTEKNRMNTQDKIELKKFCKRCRKHTVHKEKKKLH